MTVTKSYSNFFIGQNIKEFGLALVEDDYFITKVTVIGGIFNLVTRFSMGWLYSLLGFKLLYLLNMCLEMIYMAILITIARTFLGFTIFAFIWRASSGSGRALQIITEGMHFILCYISCTKMWGFRNGLKVMKYYDTHFLLANLLNVITLYFLPGENNNVNLFIVCFLANFFMSFCLLLLPKVNN